MNRLNKNQKFKQFRNLFPFFSYESHSIHKENNNLHIRFKFNLSDKYYFYPKMIFPLDQLISEDQLSEIEQLVFHIGMVEIISYWKATCSPKLIIKPFSLSKNQIQWWKKLYFNGLGEFFFLNGVDTNQEDFMSIEANSERTFNKLNLDLNDDILLPIGGGKDSIVSIEILKEQFKKITPIQLNTNPARNATIIHSGFSLADSIVIKRTIHPELFTLNEKGFLNGHTPFSALLAFTSLLAAYLYNKKHIVLSNESSASEASIIDTNINHQYSKSIEFEDDFRSYTKKYISDEFNYFSFLRPINELQIAKLFSKYKHHHKDFKSCNAGSKDNIWCGNCPKCLFVFIILSPFLSEEELINIFGKNLYEAQSLLQSFNELIGHKEVKPFECVGSIDDVNVALQLYIKNKYQHKLMFLIEHYKSLGLKTYTDQEVESHLNEINKHHNVPEYFFEYLIKELQK